MKKSYISLSLALALALSAYAKDDLTKEITIEKDYVPTEQKVAKTNMLPNVAPIKAHSKSLEFSDWASPITLNPEISAMPPYGYNTKYNFSDKRGYLDIGVGSFLNIVGSAGYKIIDDETLKLKAWYQHSSTWAGKNSSPASEIPDPIFQKQKFNDHVFGLDLSKRFWQGTLDIGAFYHFDHFNYYGGVTDKWNLDDNKQTVGEFQLSAGWKGIHQDEGLNYHAALKFNHFGFSHSLLEGYKGIKENDIALQAGASMLFNEQSSIGLDVDADYVFYSNPVRLNYNDFRPSDDDSKSFGLVCLSPYFKYYNDIVNVKLGVNLDISINDGKVFGFSPNAHADIRPADGFNVYFDAKGGKELSLLSKLSAVNRYINPSFIYSNTDSPFDGEVGLCVGPFAGLSFKGFFGYGIFNDQQLPWLPNAAFNDPQSDIIFATSFLRSVDMKGWKVGAELGYKFRNIASAKAGVTYSLQDENKGYALGLDRPEYIVDAQIKVFPIEKLSFNIDYQLRGKRSIYSLYVRDNVAPVVENYVQTKLADANLLNLGAAYQITDSFGVFVQANNILNKKWDNFFGMSAQKLNLIGGLNFVF